jgi:hypothetical protein
MINYDERSRPILKKVAATFLYCFESKRERFREKALRELVS